MVQERKPLSTDTAREQLSLPQYRGPVQVRAELRAQGEISQDTAHPEDPKDACPCTMESIRELLPSSALGTGTEETKQGRESEGTAQLCNAPHQRNLMDLLELFKS